MKIVQINTTCGIGSTGKIAVSISEALNSYGYYNKIFYSLNSNGYEQGISFGKVNYTRIQSFKSHLIGNYGFNSIKQTKKMISKLQQINPDIVLIHNIHSHDVNLELLFKYFKYKNKKVIWVFHDCWAFTGYCTHFMMCKCDKWASECNHCPQKNKFSFLIDRSNENFKKKKELFTGIDLTIITPSQWLADQVKKSFLNQCPVKVINNGINLQIFKPTENNIRAKYNIEKDRFILLGVAFNWDKSKGLDVFLELFNRLDPKRFHIILVGTNDIVDRMLPDGITSIHKTHNQFELAEIYTAANLFVNPTREDTYPTVNMEAIACGTPVLTFNTGGSPEIVDNDTGKVVECDNLKVLEEEIIRIYEENPYKKESCLNKAKKFDQNQRFREYVDFLLKNCGSNQI